LVAHRLRAATLVALLFGTLGIARSVAPARARCQSHEALYCIELIPVPDFRHVSGIVELQHPTSPFTVAVDAQGHQQFDVVATLQNLPDPRSLGSYTTYVAWAVTPNFEFESKLGEVGVGRTRIGIVGYDKFILMVTAEASREVTERHGRLVLRGMSPSWLLLPFDGKLPPRSGPSGAQHEHRHDTTGATWQMPAMHPAVPTMIAGLGTLRPNARPWWPGMGVDTTRIPMAQPRQVIALRDGDSLSLGAELIRRQIAGRTVTAYGFNGQSPGPLIRVTQGARIIVNFTNRLNQPTSIHWHGIRLDNRYDGAPLVTQELVPAHGHFRYVVRFPDAGVYWYHPHHREDTQQDLGLYGNLFVQPTRAGLFEPANREEILMLDDFLVDAGGAPVPFGGEAATHALMGRVGNVLLVNGAPDYSLDVGRGSVVRFYLTNASNARVFNVSIPGARLKLVGGDNGRFEREELVSSVVIAPAERYIVDARFDSPGRVALVNHVQAIDRFHGWFVDELDTLGIVTVTPASAAPNYSTNFDTVHSNADVRREFDRIRKFFNRRADYTLVLTLDRSNRLPFAVVQAMRADTSYVSPAEWSATMPMMDWLPTTDEVRWVLRDSSTGRENMDISWRFRIGSLVKLRLVNDRHTLHPMNHPLHIHGQRFLVLTINGQPMHNLVWKDTALIPVGGTVDLLVEMSNPGRWMMHCHIAEHLEAGMHTSFEVVQ